jgi:hypothetical protein
VARVRSASNVAPLSYSRELLYKQIMALTLGQLTFFYVDLWSRQLELQIHEEAMSAAAHGTTNEPGDRKKQPMAFELRGSRMMRCTI